MAIAPPRPKGPPLNALRAFEAAARLGGFAAAAAELCVTPGAVAQHIKALEEWVNSPLFERRSQGVVLTNLGLDVAKDFTEAFDRLGAAQRKLRVGGGLQSITIAALPAIAQLWLSPRLPILRAGLAGHTISILALETPPNLWREMVDLSIFFREPQRGAHEWQLALDSIFPVCTPDIAARLQDPSDLAGEILIHDAVWQNDWPFWFKQTGFEKLACHEGAVYSLYSIAVEEACNGAGILMGHGPLVANHLQNGRLIAPFGEDYRVFSGQSLMLESASSPQPLTVLKRVIDILSNQPIDPASTI